ncbi:ChrR family anti-sigma-E factor [Aliiglaciecola sp. 3_MG-2023]|uniref:ChrR family anti-sigma-E factor n=1 Tax=Aliiglaciecola sp. 3_MG-2023 TaxID=3062644 RepID=UPI0026E3BDF6|nr:ChrR family anti-sigma-E factor [Aliiglaciecola sp. 3_MG-2023]MDO6693945.1 ChrR family anti-sigma-E factor [Aliiglaciecola sp. 3_MG-2023]
MINFHPSQQQLREFAQGLSAPALSLVISAHADMCPICRKQLAQMERESAKALDDARLVGQSEQVVDFASMLADITCLPAAEVPSSNSISRQIELDGRKFTVPRALKRYVEKTGNWSHLLGNLWQAPVDLGPVGKANFIFMQKEGRVPEHTHRGTELTLVIDGEFSDGISHYDTGDFILMDSNNTHAPYSEASEGCLVFTIVDAPLHFTSGIARLLNPFSHLFF